MMTISTMTTTTISMTTTRRKNSKAKKNSDRQAREVSWLSGGSSLGHFSDEVPFFLN
jgi:hypothetical protein